MHFHRSWVIQCSDRVSIQSTEQRITYTPTIVHFHPFSFPSLAREPNILEALSSWAGGSRMAVKSAEVLAELTLGVDIKVLLVAEEDDASSGDQASKVL